MRIPITDKIKLSELRSSRAVMTPGPWTLDDDTPCIYGGNDTTGTFEVAVISEEAANYDGDAAGIVATHNAADALIELAEAAVAYRTSDTAQQMRATAVRYNAALARFEP